MGCAVGAGHARGQVAAPHVPGQDTDTVRLRAAGWAGCHRSDSRVIGQHGSHSGPYRTCGTRQGALLLESPSTHCGCDLAQRDADDSPVRVVLVFEGDRSHFSQRDALLSELVRAVTGEPLPYATLMYVWCNQREPGTVIASPRTGRVRTMVVESGAARLNRWLDYERDIRADFERAFGEPPGALVGVALMSDSDNTRSTAQAWYGPIRLQRTSMRKP